MAEEEIILDDDSAAEWFEKFESSNYMTPFELSDKTKLKSMVCTQLNELGLDYGALDHSGSYSSEEMEKRLDTAIKNALLNHAKLLVFTLSHEVLSLQQVNTHSDKVSKILTFTDMSYSDLFFDKTGDDDVFSKEKLSEEDAKERYNTILQNAYFGCALNVFSIIEQRPNSYDYKPEIMGFKRTISDDITQINLALKSAGKTFSEIDETGNSSDSDIENRIKNGRRTVLISMARSIYEYLLKAKEPLALNNPLVSKTLRKGASKRDDVSKYFKVLQKEIEIQLDRAGASYKDLDPSGQASDRMVKKALQNAQKAMYSRVVREERSRFRNGIR